ncbi:hypothetical protein [Spiroplasma endosymbiont of Polydrusus pterygomalis]|uniref:hypothetical protein n=1 Tax=Spiroplasma endosymbiont of Polydrusus pterygomalis TaxID=3139327 RepID=UPI003CCA7199
MQLKEFENLILNSVKELINKIIIKNLKPKIYGKARIGATISDYFEDEFIKISNNHKNIKNVRGAEKSNTKSSYDIIFSFVIDEINLSEIILIDFKAIKKDGSDSNPDIGSVKKVINLIRNGSFYILYVYYMNELGFVEFVKNNNEYSKLYFLKDVSSSFRRTPTNQLQVNVDALPTYRTRTRKEFINLFILKIKQSHIRAIKKSNDWLLALASIQDEISIKNENIENNLLDKLKKLYNKVFIFLIPSSKQYSLSNILFTKKIISFLINSLVIMDNVFRSVILICGCLDLISLIIFNLA